MGVIRFGAKKARGTISIDSQGNRVDDIEPQSGKRQTFDEVLTSLEHAVENLISKGHLAKDVVNYPIRMLFRYNTLSYKRIMVESANLFQGQRVVTFANEKGFKKFMKELDK